MIERRPTGLTPAKAIAEMEDILRVMEGETDRLQLKDVAPDEAFEFGYKAALLDYRYLTSPKARFVTEGPLFS